MEPMELTIEKLIPGGFGLGRHEGRAVFVPDTAPGDRILAVITEDKGGRLVARMERLLAPGPDRIPPFCPHQTACGGCPLQHLTYPAQLAAKQGFIAENLTRIGGLKGQFTLGGMTASPGQTAYRHRAGLKLRRIDGVPMVGFYETDSRRVVDLPGCPLLHPALSRLFDPLRALLKELPSGERLPQVDLVAGDRGVAILFHFVAPPEEADRQQLVAFGREQGMAEVWIQAGQKASARSLHGDGEVVYEAGGVTFGFSPQDFIQANLAANRVLVDWVLAAADGREVLDLFCGIGNFTLPLARRGGSALGVESVGTTVERARKNAHRNRLKNTRFRVADLFTVRDLTPFGQPDLVVLDPPRLGARQAAALLPALAPARILYVACDAATFARDAGILVKGGYRMGEVAGLDLYPHTRHVELMAVFERVGRE